MVALVKTLQVILALSLLIIAHEFGHFIWARIFGIRVEKFYLFFGKAIVKWHWGETEFGIGWIPFGGYCKISGMIDESMDLEQLKKGEAYISNRDARIAPNELAREMGFRLGDHIIDFDGYEPENFGMLQADLARRDVREARILRDADTLQLYIDHSFMGDVLNSPAMFDLAVPFVIDSMSADGPNGSCGLFRGDRVLAFDGQPVSFIQDARPVLAAHAGETIEASVLRGADTLAVPVRVDSLGQVGVYLATPPVERRQYSLLQSVPAGLRLTWETITGYVRDLGLLVRPSTGAYKSVGSFIAIGQVFPAVWDWYRFLSILALLSVMLGIMNLLPIPALDGGHILFTLYEMITGRKPSDRFLTVMQLIGMILLMALMVLAFGNDIARLIH